MVCGRVAACGRAALLFFLLFFFSDWAAGLLWLLLWDDRSFLGHACVSELYRTYLYIWLSARGAVKKKRELELDLHMALMGWEGVEDPALEFAV